MQEFPSEVTKFDFFFFQSQCNRKEWPHARPLNYGDEDMLFELFLPCNFLCFFHNFFFFHCEVTLFTQQRMSHASDICVIPLFACRPHMAIGPHARRATNWLYIKPIHEIIIATSHTLYPILTYSASSLILSNLTIVSLKSYSPHVK